MASTSRPFSSPNKLPSRRRPARPRIASQSAASETRGRACCCCRCRCCPSTPTSRDWRPRETDAHEQRDARAHERPRSRAPRRAPRRALPPMAAPSTPSSPQPAASACPRRTPRPHLHCIRVSARLARCTTSGHGLLPACTACVAVPLTSRSGSWRQETREGARVRPPLARRLALLFRQPRSQEARGIRPEAPAVARRPRDSASADRAWARCGPSLCARRVGRCNAVRDCPAQNAESAGRYLAVAPSMASLGMASSVVVAPVVGLSLLASRLLCTSTAKSIHDPVLDRRPLARPPRGTPPRRLPHGTCYRCQFARAHKYTESPPPSPAATHVQIAQGPRLGRVKTLHSTPKSRIPHVCRTNPVAVS